MLDCNLIVPVVVLSLALLLSLCLNVVFYVKRRAFCRDKDNCCSSHNFEEESLTQADEHYFHDLVNHHEQQENPHDYHEQLENPIYGNISVDRREPCYETMTKQKTRDGLTRLEPDLNYASLDLKVAKKRRKHRHLGQGPSGCQDQLLVHQSDFLEVEADMDAHLPSRDTSTMVSHSSIYLNSQQIAQEAEEIERERSADTESDGAAWEGARRQDDVGSRKWRERRSQESGDRQDDGDQTACTQLPEGNEAQRGTESFNSSFNVDSDQQR
ncbi:uncharacterized protein LOC114870062 [Betta splendens]|uniref:Uncharacterized protein LOC114870062 n=1 Tax=Betta splendens TaxID=158456 RepID=A0A6P7PNT3_BETSP|nr:uncharacterized protein LOC114870062 [Betta splendens]